MPWPGRAVPRTLQSGSRGIEGLPVRLVIALVVGVASLSVLMNMLSGISGLAVAELDVQPTPEVTTPGNQTVVLRVVTAESQGVANATVVVRGGSAHLEAIKTARTNGSGVAVLRLAPSLGPNQAEGTVAFAVKPPAGSKYVDRRENTNLLIVAS